MSVATIPIAKSGWVWRQTSILRRWKRNWFVLRLNGDLDCFDSQDDWEPEDSICIPVECSFFKQSHECEVNPPSDINRDALFAIVTAEKTVYCCAESLDDGQAWLFMLEQAKTFRPSSRTTSSGNRNVPLGRNYQMPPEYSPMTSPPPAYDGSRNEYVIPQRVIHHPDGRTTVVYGEGACCQHRGRCGCSNASLGLVAGAATGALLFSPFLWWPFWF